MSVPPYVIPNGMDDGNESGTSVAPPTPPPGLNIVTMFAMYEGEVNARMDNAVAEKKEQCRSEELKESERQAQHTLIRRLVHAVSALQIQNHAKDRRLKKLEREHAEWKELVEHMAVDLANATAELSEINHTLTPAKKRRAKKEVGELGGIVIESFETPDKKPRGNEQ